MKVVATVNQSVDINESEFITKMIQNTFGKYVTVYSKDNKFYMSFEVGLGGNHTWNEVIEIDKDIYDYYNALQTVLKYTSDKNFNNKLNQKQWVL